MVDFLTPEQRSVRMSAIKGRKNKTTELALTELFRQGHIKGWRRHYKIQRTRPDFVFTRVRLAIFVDGCFWHACPIHYRLPTSNTTFWATKARANKARDKKATARLRAQGWQVIRIWEHSLAKPSTLLARIRRALAKQPVSNRTTSEGTVALPTDVTCG